MNQALWTELRQHLPNCLRRDRLRLEPKITRAIGTAGGPARVRDEQIQAWIDEAQRSVRLRHRRHERLPQVSYPPELPITAKKDEILQALRKHQVIVVAGETGSGKTTQIPKICLEAGLGVEGKIGCTQPRRVAALSISRRIAQELGVSWGEEVGSKIRFSDKSSPATYIKLMTDGILLAETQADPDLNEYDAIVIDEAHERSLNIDFLLGHLQQLLRRRPELKLIITSATIDTEAFSKAFGNAPIIEVSGRTYPVEVRYAPHDVDAEESGDLTYIDAAVSAVEDVLLESSTGDVLVFMPTERDIRETQDDLQGRFGQDCEVVPLFGRLSSGEQERVFAPSARRKLIVATNIAETSLTIPGIRYVIDTGLARISRYSPRTRTKRLPIEPISQSSANQRAGRSGRVQDGVCIRLYSEEDFGARPKYTQPEIQRANLADVILKMKAWRLGEIESFPFLNPPQSQAITSGYQLLQELGALDEERNLTAIGRELARLPVDPSIGRMILQSQCEGALEDVLVVAAGLSIQDARERPMDRQEAADQAHRQFLDSHSDFLTLLNIWNAFDARLEALRTQNQMRKFCKSHFLSYLRMREWIDIHAQLSEAVRPEAVHAVEQTIAAKPAHAASGHERRRAKPAANSPFAQRGYAAIHRSVLVGLLPHIGQRAERNQYRTAGNRQIMLWPGSGLFDRNESRAERGPRRSDAEALETQSKTQQPEWIVAGEIVETSRLYGRTVAGIDADWISELAAHLIKRSYGEPFWEPRTGRVLVRERITLFGLEVQERPIDYGRVNPEEATALFIRSALVQGDFELPHRFVAHNRQLRERLELWRTKVRDHRLANLEDALCEFYAARLGNVSSVHDLNRIVRERIKEDPNFLCANESDLTGGASVSWDAQAFPPQVTLANEVVPLQYAYAPGKEHDGITVKLPVTLAQRLEPAMLDWVIPGLRQEQIEFLLKALSKPLRVQLMPLGPKVIELAASIGPGVGLDQLRQLVRDKYGVAIPPDVWRRDTLPEHLRPRIAITNQQQQVVATGRELEPLKQALAQHETSADQAAWAQAVQRWERYDLGAWSFGDLPEQLEVCAYGGSKLYAFPGLELDAGRVNVKLFRDRRQAQAATPAGFVRLVELALPKELAWAQKDLRALERQKDLFAGFISSEDLLASAYANLRKHLVKLPDRVLPLSKAAFEEVVQQARQGIALAVPKLIETTAALLQQRQVLLRHRALAVPEGSRPGVLSDLKQLGGRPGAPFQKGLSHLRAELDWLMPANYLTTASFEKLPDLLRYLKALQVRADRAVVNPSKDLEKAAQVRPFAEAYNVWNRRTDLEPAVRGLVEQYRWLVEEFKVSVFAQELRTAQPVSPKRLENHLHLLRQAAP